MTLEALAVGKAKEAAGFVGSQGLKALTARLAWRRAYRWERFTRLYAPMEALFITRRVASVQSTGAPYLGAAAQTGLEAVA
jgi:hypothetical protein